ncbi:hypothetical protein CASFOL_010955 [Castilleja foliolosa]|uniref:CCHC-type domain-containing protein n=1 Tax=Castilleja foliolosa TaxID=1961234 RepID=A0ABD3DY42_9LAMI
MPCIFDTKEGQHTESSKRGRPPVRCFKCQGYGHVQADCPNRHIVTFVGEDKVPVFDEFSDDDELKSECEGELVHADQGAALIVRRVLNIAPTSNEQWLRHNIFQTKCTTKGKVCKVIVDGGSCENVVSTYMVKKLELPTEDHPQPYQLSWLVKGNILKVQKRCLVQFSIGKKYFDEVWCDVVPMDACHLLLGRPWLFDRRVKHDGFKNTYTFRKDGVLITLRPTTDVKSNRIEDDGIAKDNLFTKASFVAAATEANQVYESHPKAPIDLVPRPTVTTGDAEDHASRIQELHEQVSKRVIQQNERYKRAPDMHRNNRVFQVGDLVLIHLQKERFPAGRFKKLNPPVDGPFRIVERINNNAYKVDLPGKYNVSATFNVADLSPYLSDDAMDADSWSSLSQPGEYDATNDQEVGPQHVVSMVSKIHANL